MISFIITTKNEGLYISDLLSQLRDTVREDDEVIIIDDYSDDKNTVDILQTWSSHQFKCSMNVHKRHLNGDFASHKNFGIEKATQPWIFQIDADEILSDNLIQNIHVLLENNPEVDLFLVPRVNIVHGLTQEDVDRWNWKINDMGWVMWPDYQHRIFKNKSEIRWEGKVHEQIVGIKTFTALPISNQEDDCDVSWALLHIKEIERQREQNRLYERIEG